MPVGLNVVHSLVLFGSEMACNVAWKNHIDIASYKKTLYKKSFECE